jgi:predicted metal-dependent hydrolase
MHTAESLVPEPGPSAAEIAIKEWRRYKSPGIDQILAELIQAEDKTWHSKIRRLINFIWNKEELAQPWKDSCTCL